MSPLRNVTAGFLDFFLAFKKHNLIADFNFFTNSHKEEFDLSLDRGFAIHMYE